MAKEAKKDPQELTVEQKLKALFQLQTMLSKIDEIKTLRGELPLEVQDLEDEIAGLSTRIDRIKAEVAELKSSIAGKKVEIETAKASVAKYKDQQENRIPDIGNRTLRKAYQGICRTRGRKISRSSRKHCCSGRKTKRPRRKEERTGRNHLRDQTRGREAERQSQRTGNKD